MNAIEFTTELNGASSLVVPEEVASKLPKSGRAGAIVLTQDDGEESNWRRAIYEQFFCDDSAEDAIYDAKAWRA